MAMAMALQLSSPNFGACPSTIWNQENYLKIKKTKNQKLGLMLRCRISDPSVVKRSADAFFIKDHRPIILFDGVCNLCNGAVNIVLDNDPKGSLRLAALQSEAGRALLQRCGRSPDDISSIVLVEKNRSSIKSEAVLRIANYLRAPFPLIATLLYPLPLFLKDTVYDTVATNRYTIFGQSSECRLSDASYQDRFIE